jgi:hypothetical protein
MGRSGTESNYFLNNYLFIIRKISSTDDIDLGKNAAPMSIFWTDCSFNKLKEVYSCDSSHKMILEATSDLFKLIFANDTPGLARNKKLLTST